MIEAVNLAKGVRPPVDPYNLSFENPDCERDFLRLEYYMLAVFWQNRVLVGKRSELELEHQRKSRELEAARQIQMAMCC